MNDSRNDSTGGCGVAAAAAAAAPVGSCTQVVPRTVVTGAPTPAAPARPSTRRGQGNNDNNKRNNTNGNSNCSSSNWNPVFMALAASAAVGLQATSCFVCNFVTVKAKDGEVLAIVRTSAQVVQESTTIGIYCAGDFYAYGANSTSNEDFMWKLARIFCGISLVMGGLCALMGWTLVVSTPSCMAVSPTRSIWTGLAALASMAALLQVPAFLVFEAYPCADFTLQQSCRLDMGSYLLMASVVAWIGVTALTQLLDPPAWARNLEQWRVPKAQSTQDADEDDDEMESTCEEDDVLYNMEGGLDDYDDDYDDYDDDDDDDDEGSQDPIFSPRPRNYMSNSAPPLHASSSRASSSWDKALPWRSTSASSSPRKSWHRCVKGSSKTTTSKSPSSNVRSSSSSSQQPRRVVQRYSYSSAARTSPSFSNKSNNNHHHHRSSNLAPSARGLLEEPTEGGLQESSLLVEEAVESSYEESSTTLESTAKQREQQQPNTWSKLVSASSPFVEVAVKDKSAPPRGEGGAPPVLSSDLLNKQQQLLQEHLAEARLELNASSSDNINTQQQLLQQHLAEARLEHHLEGAHNTSSDLNKQQQLLQQHLAEARLEHHQQQQKSPEAGGLYQMQVLLQESDHGDVPCSESLTASSWKSSTGRDSPITGDESILDKEDQSESSSSSSSSSEEEELLQKQQPQQEELSTTPSEEHNKKVAVNGGSIYRDLLAEDEKKDNSGNDEANVSSLIRGALLGDSRNAGDDIDDEHDEQALLQNRSSESDPFFSELASSTIHANTSSSGFLDITSNTNLTNSNNTTTTASRILGGGVGLLGRAASFRRGTAHVDSYYPFENDHDDDEEDDFSRGPPISEVQIYKDAAGDGASSALDDSIMNTTDNIHPISSSSEQELLDAWNNLFDPLIMSEDYAQAEEDESFVSGLEEDEKDVSSFYEDDEDRHKSTSTEEEEDDDDGDAQQQQQSSSTRGRTMEHDADRAGGETSDPSDNNNNNNTRPMRRSNSSGGGGVTLRPRRQHRRSRHMSDSVSSATSLLSYTIEEETDKDLMEEVDVDYYDYQHEDDDELMMGAGRRPKKQAAIPMHRTQSLPYPQTTSSSLVHGDNGDESNLPPQQQHQHQHHYHRAESLSRVALLDAEERVQNFQSHDKKAPQQQNVDDDDDASRGEPIVMQRRRSRSLETDRKKSKRRTSSRSLSPEPSLDSDTPKSNSNKNMWRVDRESRGAIHNAPVVSMSESSDDDDAAVAMRSLTTISADPNRARLARIQRLQRERGQLQQQQPSDPSASDPSTGRMDDASVTSDEIKDDTTIETVEPIPQNQGKLLLHCALTPRRRGGSSASMDSSSAGGGLDDSMDSSIAHHESYLLDTLDVSLAKLQRDDEMEYGPDENSI